MSQQEIHFDEVISRYRSDPYDYVDIHAIHAGLVHFKAAEGTEVQAESGEWQHIPGTPLYEITRERNLKVVTARTNGIVSFLNTALDGKFVEAGEKLMTIRHPLKKKEIIESIL
ncbi:MAG TPA: hypothetical protein ENH16_04410, partial [Desulfobacteraceae bacterium]|nr:hypothetical protein [Desulfobacteraceae bacterium]